MRSTTPPACSREYPLWGGPRRLRWPQRPELVAECNPLLGQVRSKDMASVSVSGNRVLIAWRTTLLNASRGAPQYGVEAATRDRYGRLPWASVPRVNLAGLPGENTDASDPCALVLPDGTLLVSYWRQDRPYAPPQIRVSSKPAMARGWTRSGALAPMPVPGSGVRYHLFCHLEHDDCRVIGIWEGRQQPLGTQTGNGAYISGSRGRAKWEVPTDAGYFEVPGTGQGPTKKTVSNALFPGFCTGGGEIHLVWLQTVPPSPIATLYYATGVLA